MNNVKVFGPLNSGVAAGGAGVATNNGSSTIDINGFLVAIYVKYNDSPPATADVTVSTVGTSPKAPAMTLLTLTDANTSGYFYPRIEQQSTVAAGLSTYDLMPIDDKIKVTVAQANNGDSVDIWVFTI